MMYLDDALIVHDSKDECLGPTDQTISLIESLGFQISTDKSSLSPQNQKTYLGLYYTPLICLFDHLIKKWTQSENS